MHIIDRRLNPKGKSLPNRQRFLRRAKALVRDAVHESSASRGVRDVEQGGELSIPKTGVSEPTFHHGQGSGIRDHVLPGNKEFVEGDRLPRPPGGGGRGSEGSPDGGGEDDFRFALSRDEFVDLFLEDLELPDLVKQKVAASESVSWHRAGYSPSGAPANMALGRTMRNSLSRRIALKRPNKAEIRRLYEEIEERERKGEISEDLEALRAELAELLQKTSRIPFVDPIDVRYKRFDPKPKPVARAVMFCLMDVSGSMTEDMKDLAKRFFMLLHIFLARRYKHVDVVFIRHTHTAQEVDEDTFFHNRETGGTIVSTALEEMLRVVRERYPVSDWNIYAAQASDGDNITADAGRVLSLMQEDILPICQYYAYIEVGRGDGGLPGHHARRESDLWSTYRRIMAPDVPMAMRKVNHRREIFPVFRDLFKKDGDKAVGRVP
ncbi:YeaH/YhbH family protein [Caenispirillum salinarum]|uniref:YeaH/YhbH family protein n=1 Tax=Caenispirillum salinarum TaxID=859058 RepID=UPI00385132BC